MGTDYVDFKGQALRRWRVRFWYYLLRGQLQLKLIYELVLAILLFALMLMTYGLYRLLGGKAEILLDYLKDSKVAEQADGNAIYGEE